MKLPQMLPYEQMLTKWASILNPILSNLLMSGTQLTNIPLIVGNNSVNHLLGRKYNGYIITGMHNNYSQIFDATSQTPNLTIVLNSSAITTVDLYVY